MDRPWEDLAAAQAGMLSMLVKKPLINMKIIIKKKATNMACNWLLLKVEISRANPSNVTKVFVGSI